MMGNIMHSETPWRSSLMLGICFFLLLCIFRYEVLFFLAVLFSAVRSLEVLNLVVSEYQLLGVVLAAPLCVQETFWPDAVLSEHADDLLIDFIAESLAFASTMENFLRV